MNFLFIKKNLVSDVSVRYVYVLEIIVFVQPPPFFHYYIHPWQILCVYLMYQSYWIYHYSLYILHVHARCELMAVKVYIVKYSYTYISTQHRFPRPDGLYFYVTNKIYEPSIMPFSYTRILFVQSSNVKEKQRTYVINMLDLGELVLSLDTLR